MKNPSDYYITVAKLIEQLKEVDPNRIVVMSSDGEGNSYSPFSCFYEGAYRPNSTWSGEVGLEFITEDDETLGYEEDDVFHDGIPCIVLKPIN